MSGINNFKVDAANYLGLQHQEYLNNMYSKALSRPDDYFKLRALVYKTVKEQAITDLYETYYNLLSVGTDKAGNQISGLDAPNLPNQVISDLCISAASTLSHILDDVLNKILPADYKLLAETRAAKVADAAISSASVV